MTEPALPAPAAPALSAAEELLAHFARRVAQRDAAPEPGPGYFEQAQVEARIGEALTARLGRLHAVRRRSLAALLYVLMQQPRLDIPQLRKHLDLTDQTFRLLTNLLAAEGLVEVRPQGRWNTFGLTRAGEDWLLPVVQGIARSLPG